MPVRRPDEGFSLIEVLMALTLITVTMAAAGPFFVSSVLSANRQRGQQAAVQLADSAMEQVRALKGSSLLTGRGINATKDQWAIAAKSAPIKAYLDTMQQAADPLTTDPAAGATAAISTAPQTMTVTGLTFTRTVLVGICDIWTTDSKGCVYHSGDTAPADTTDILKFFRVVVAVSWPEKNCTGGACLYVTSTLVARASEPTFDFHRPAPVINTRTVYFYQGVAGSFQLDVSGGQLPDTWTISSTPAGLTMTPAGVVSGTATAAVGSYATMATVTDTLQRNDTETITFQIVLPPALTVPVSPGSHVGDTVSQKLTATGGVTPFTYTAEDLPPGLTLASGTGAITGTVTTAGTYAVTATATDANGGTATKTYTHVVAPALTIGPITDQTISLGNPLSVAGVAAGGDGNYTYSAVGLPTGTVIDASSGAVSGVPLVPGRYVPTVTVTDGLNGTASTTFVLIVTTTSQLIFTSPDVAAPDQTSPAGKNVNFSFDDNSKALGLKPTLAVTGLPPGLTANLASGKISGKPTTPGSYTVTAVETNLLPPQTAVLTFVWTIT